MKNITKKLLAIIFFLISFEGVEAQVQSCNSMPEPVTYTTVGTPTEKRVEETAVVRGITVTRILEVRGSAGDKIMYSNQETIPGDTQSDETYCGKSRKNTFGGKKYPFMDSNKVSKITYKFSKPVIDVEVFLAAFGYSGTRKSGGWQSYPHIDVVKITTNKGTATLHARSTCGENNLLTVSGNEISSIDHKTTDAKIGITSTEPFTELVLQVIEKRNQTGGYGFFVEICLASIIADASCDTMPNAQFGREQDATATMGGVKVTRSYIGKGNFSNAGEPRGPIYCQSSYSGDLPWVLNSNNNINTLTYTFEEPVTEAELWFVGMGGGNGISAYDKAKVSVNCDNITLREAFRCNGSSVDVTNPSANSRLISVSNPTKVTDIAYKVTSSKPFTEITIEDSSDAQAAGYLVEMCPTSVKKANIITVNTALTEQTVCDNTGNAPSYLAKATITPTYAGGTLNYELQAKKKGSTTWETITTNNSVTNDLTYQPSALKALAYNEATVRIKYTYSNSAKFCGVLTKYSNEVKLNVNASTTITTQPATSVAYCKDATPTALSVTATGQGTLSYQWYSNTTNNNTGGTLITGANAATYTPPTTIAGSTYYYVAVTGTCGTVTSTVARVQALTASDVITINTPNYNNINGICNTNSTISAQATIAPNYSNKIKNLGGGNFFAYQLEYRKTPTSPWENYYNQVYSNNGNGWTRTFSINPNNTPSGATFRVRYTADIVGLCDNLTVYSNEFTYTKQAVTTITTQPVTPTTPICKDATATALNVVATGEGTLTYQWYSNTTNNNTGGSLITGANVATYTPPTTATGTTYYYAVVTGSCGVATSTVAKVDVLTPPEVTQIIATPPAFKQGESASVEFTIKGTPNAQVTYNINGTGTQVVTLNSSGTYTLPSRTVNQTTILNVTKVKLGACEQNYTDKSGGILATTAKCTTKPAPQFATTPPSNGQTAVMNGVTVTRTYSEPSRPNLVYGNTDMGTYCSGSTYHNYTIIHTNSTFSPKVIYTFSQPITNAEVWLMVMGSPSTVNDKVKLSTNNGVPTFTKVYDCAEGKGQAGATLSNTGEVTSQDRIITDVAVRVTSNTPFTQLIVEDINGADSSGVLVELCPTSITPAETISITTQPQSQTICADKMATFTSKAQLKDATGNIQYKWQQSTNGATWTDIASSQGTITSGATASLTTAGIANYKYRVVYSYKFTADVVVTATSQEVTLTKLPSVALPTLSGNMTLCPTATPNNVSFANYVTAAAGTTLRWYDTATATTSNTTAPTINTQVTTRTTQTAYVRALSTAGCTSGIVTVTLTVDDTTAPTFTAPTPLNIVCNSTTATTAISNWLGTATATDTCGAIATITNNYNAPADLCTVPGGIITVTFVAKDTFGNTQTRTSTIHLGVTPLVVKDDSFTVPDGLRTQTTISVLDNDSLGGTKPTAGVGGTVTITNVTGATPINGGKVPTLDPNTGVVTIPANTPAGIYTITYKECETLNLSSNCRTATAEIKVGTPTIAVTPETLTVTPSTATQTIPNILNNDKIGGTVTPTVGVGGNVTLTVTNPNTPGKKPTLDPNTGEVTIPGNTPAGTYTITYSYCEVLNPTNCTGTQTLVVTVGAATLTVVNDSFTVPDGLRTQTTISVLDNDSLGGTKPTAGAGGTVTITNVTGATPINGGKVPTLDPNTGVVTIPANTPAGTYTITYKECETLNLSSNCQTATAVIKVGTPTITVTPETLTVTPSTATQTIPNILNNDKIGGTVTPTVGVGGNVTLTVTNPNTPGKKPTLDPNTGEVTIPGNTPAGTYTITYSYCEVLNPTNCTGTQTLVVTVGAATLTVVNDSFTVPDGLRTQTTISVLDNDSLGGTKPTAGAGGTVTITNVTGATPINGGKVPTLDPNTGVVTIPANTPAGTYTITYKECETLNLSSNCRTATAEIKVGTPTITVVSDPMTVTPSTTTQTIPSILNNDKIGGTVTPTAGPGGNVTMTVNNPSNPGNKPTLDPNTGEVTIPGNTPAGTYTITYSYCEVLNPTNCTGTQTLVVTVGAATLTVVNDSFTVPDGLTTQTTISVLDNDSLGGTKPTAGAGGTVTITNVTGATPINGGKVPTLDTNTGVVTIPANTPAGTYTITYKECETLNPNSNCQTATAVIKVGTPTITVVPDPMTVTPSTTTQTIPSILNNDKIGGSVIPTAGPGGNVTMTVTNPSNPGNKPTLDPNTGEVTIPGNTPAGTYTITYSYCEVLNPTNCTGTQTLVVTVGAATLTVVNDSFTVPDGLTTQTTISVLDNDQLNGTKPTAGVGGTVTITNVTGATPINGGKVPTLDPNTGVVTIPANTPAGIYTITYKECEALNPSSNCKTATAEIKVGTPTITVTPETLTVTPSTATQTIPSILNNDKIGGTVTPTAGPGGNVTMTVTNPSNPGNKPTLDPNTGEVTIPGNTPAGTYTITYSYCEVLNPTNCTGTQTLVVTVGAATLTVQNDSFTVPDGLRTQTTISVLDNDSLGGTKPTAGAGGTVTITNVTGATPINGGKVPTLDPNTGVVTIPANTPAGIYTITYKECETLNLSSNCRTATAEIKVGTPTITVTPETLTVTPSTATQTIPSILNNDKIGGTVTPTAGPGGNVTMTVTNPSNPGNKPTLDPNTGEVTIPGNTPAGTYTITYSYCEVLNPTNCTGTQTLVVTVGAATLTVQNDSFTVPDGLRTQTTISVLDNDSLGGTKPTAGVGGTVTITNVTGATPINGGKVPTLDPNTGVVTIPANTPAGIYTITYKECETLNLSSNCRTATAEIKVGTPTITVTPETLTVTPSTATQTIPNILNNDKIGGTVTPTVGVGGNVTLTVTNPNTPGKKPTLDPNTGEVTIPGNTPAGTYTITYSYCEVLNPTNCTGTQTLVVTVGAATLTVQNDSFTVPDGLTTQTTISVLDNDSLGGTKPTAGAGGTVTITNVTGATPINGGKVPTLDPNTGVVTIPANTPAGTYTITYKECETLNLSSNCRTATAEIKVGTPTITVTPETLTVTPSTATQTIPNILNNDKIGGTVTPTVGVGGNVTMTVTNPSNPGNKPTLDPNTGEVTIPGNTPAGTYTITYSYCEVLNPTNCTGTQTLVVTVGAATLTVVNDSFTIPDGLTTQTTISVLDNDSLGGTKPTAGAGGTVTITNVTGATPINGGKVPTLDPNTGVVTIPANTPAGIYTITYKECEALNPSSNCQTATAEIKVGTPTITVTPETLTVTPSTTTQTIPNILNNDKIGGTVTPTVGVGGNVTLTVTNPNTPGKKPTLDPNTGEVTILGNTPAGTYTITYSYCEVLNPTNCTGTQTLVVTVGAATLTVVNDSFTVPDGLRTQTTISVLDNDSLGGTKPTAGAGGTVTITNVTGATPINGGKVPTLDPNTGVVTIPANTPAGTYTITYKECETLNLSSNCRTATAEIKVGTPTITVTPETLTVTPSTTTQTIPSILNNDKIGGTVTPTAGPGGNVTMTVNNPSNPGNKPTLDPNTGEVTIPGNTPAGTYTITYSYCEVLNPTNCTGTQTLVVTVGAATLTVQDDTFNIPDGLTTQTTISVLDNDSLGGTKPTAGNGGTVTITNVVPATPINGGNVPVLNPENGVVTIPANTPAGTYTITYKECEALNPNSNCQTATAVIKVGTPTITVVPDPMTVTPSTTTQTIPSILNNDKIGGSVIPTAGPGGNVTMTVTNPSNPGNKPTLDPNTGEVTIPGNTPAGTYTITYSYCEVLNPTNCTGTQTLVVTVGAATLTVVNDSFTVPDGLTTQTTISVLDNDSLGGTKPTAGAGGTVTITNVTGATPINGGKVPTLDTNTGVVTIPANTPAGTYTITYKECETLNLSSNCRTATAEIKVGTPTITVTPETLTVTPSTATQTIPNILNNDKIGGTVTPTVGVGGNVTMTVTNPSNPGNKPTLDPNTGEVTIPGNTPAGTYTITYSYCEVLNPTNCTGTQTLVVTVVGTVTPTALPIAVDDRASTAMNTPINIAVLANDTLNGATTPNVVTSPANGTVVVNADNTVEYRPHTGFVGTDTFVYEICNSAGCSSATVTVDIVNKIVPYNGMSVDGDGKNDYFHIGGIENYPNNVVRIYNRWGVKVFEVSGYDNVTRVFKGISDGRVTVEASDKLPQGTYYYVIEYYDQNNNKQSEVGWLYLKK